MKEKLNWLLHAVDGNTWTLLSIYFSSPSSFPYFWSLIKHEFSQVFLGFFTCSTFIMSHKGHKRVSMMISHLPWIERKIDVMMVVCEIFFIHRSLTIFFFVSSSIAKESFSISSNLWISQEKFNLFLLYLVHLYIFRLHQCIKNLSSNK